MSDTDLPRIDVGAPQDGDALGAPLHDGMVESMPAWARPGKRQKVPHYRALQGMSAKQVERSLRALAPNAYGQVAKPQLSHDSVWLGADGRSAGEQWQQYLNSLANREIAITAQNDALVTTTGRLAGGGKGRSQFCSGCGQKAAVLVDGRCQDGCS